ncbi:MAG TPA: heavy metal translocating P-type ATPase [Ignavibacteriaceae bacterium]|nr:heavy metal translocating P-type ATPase [Ignavibacteriaceae bacterium]
MKELKIEKLSLPVEGMTCASCVARVEKTIAKLDGIKNVSVNLATEKASFEYDPDLLDFKKLADSIEDAGYKLDLSLLDKQSLSTDSAELKVDTHLKELKNDLLFAAVLSVPILLINMGMMWEGFFLRKFLNIEEINKILLILTTPVVFVSGKRFYKIFWNNLKHFTADMNSLVAIGTGAAFVFSLLLSLFPEWFSHQHNQLHVYFDTTAVIITLILLGRWLESRAKSKTGTAIKKLIELQPKTAIVKENNREIEKRLEDLKSGDIVVIKPGGKIPADGVIISGTSTVNEAMITGESLPVEKNIGASVIGGTINSTGSFEFRITEIGNNSVLGQIIKLVEAAQGSKAPIQNLADKVAAVFVPIVVGIALATFFIWLFLSPDNFSFALMNFVAVLIIACPCALGLATPTALIVGMGKGAQSGILFKDGESLEALNHADIIIFDKTGTITDGILSVNDIYTNNISEEEFLSLLASLESKSEHPIAKAIMNYSLSKSINLKTISEFAAAPGKGLKAKFNDDFILAGNKSYMKENNVDMNIILERFKTNPTDSSSIIYLAVNGEAKGYVTVNDSIKSNASEVVRELKQNNLEPVLLTGDNFIVAKRVSDTVGISKFEAEVLPENKSSVVKKFQSNNKKVVMVGDGINDAPALVQSDVGIAIGTGTDVAIESANVVLMNGDLGGIVQSFKLSKQTIRVIKQNLFWAFIYNVIGIPLAALGLLNPMFAALAMSFSSVSVVSNSLRLKRMKL